MTKILYHFSLYKELGPLIVQSYSLNNLLETKLTKQKDYPDLQLLIKIAVDRCVFSQSAFLKSLDIFDLDTSKRQTQEGYSNFPRPREETSLHPHLSLHYDL